MTGRLATLIAIAATTAASGTEWRLAFQDDGCGAWEQNWFLEGAMAWVTNGTDGMTFSAGPVPNENTSHAVLWTRQGFKGDVKVEYDYTRIDDHLDVGAVNILYIQATGLGSEEWPTDIFLSTEKRGEPWMKSYFLHMNALHISYSCSGPDRADYVSARRYPAKDTASFQTETQILPVYEDIHLFEPGKTYHIVAVKQGSQLSFSAECDGQVNRFEWDTSAFPPVTEGRIGFRHMWTRCSRYRNIKVFVLNGK